MSVEYQDHGMKHPAECLLCAIDFDAEILTLAPLNDFYQQKEFKANLKYCFLSKRMKAESVNGKKVKDRVENDLKVKKIGVYIEDDEGYDETG